MPPRIFGSCASLNELCALCVVAGDLDRAVEFGEQGLAISEHRGELFIRGYLLTFLAQASWLRGERPRAEALARDAELTRRQLEIARLIAEDLTNRQVADRLFLSERTVETHITNMLNKLGLNSRIQLSRWLAGRAD